MTWGWELYDDNGSVLSSSENYNCFYIDSWESNPGSYEGDSDTYNKSFPEYAHCKVEVIVGSGTLTVSGDRGSSLDVKVTYNASGIPTVYIRETMGNTAGTGSTFWITTSKIDTRSPLNKKYGIELFDKSGGVAFPGGSKPFVYGGKGKRVPYEFDPSTSTDEPIDAHRVGGVMYFETWSPIPPLCFWRSTVTDGKIPPMGGVRKSMTAPKEKNYRWAIGIDTLSFSGFPLIDPETLDAYCFEVQGNTTKSDYGIQVFDGSSVLSLTDQKPLNISKQAIITSDYELSGHDLVVKSPHINPAMLPLGRWIKTNAYRDFNGVRWKTPRNGSYVFGDHYRTTVSSGRVNESSPGYTASWYRNKIINNQGATHLIDPSLYY